VYCKPFPFFNAAQFFLNKRKNQDIFGLLKKISAILFLTAYLFSATECRQLLKLPLLIEHFAEHKQEDKDLSLWQFLCMHYANGNPKDADYDKDMQLPFKSSDNGSIATGTYVPFAGYAVAEKSFYSAGKSYFVSNEAFLSAAHLSSIWQPPRSC